MRRYEQQWQCTVSFPFCAILSRLIVILEGPPFTQATIGKFLVEGLSLISVE
jgi:hypothetical protein